MINCNRNNNCNEMETVLPHDSAARWSQMRPSSFTFLFFLAYLIFLILSFSRTVMVGCVHTIALHCGTSSMSWTAPVPSLLLAPESAFPTSLSRRGYRHHCAGDALVKSAFLHAMLTTIVKTDRNEKRCTRMIDRSFIKLARDIKLKLPTSRAGFQMNPHVLPVVITLYTCDNNQCARV